jgi:hypothetical protein
VGLQARGFGNGYDRRSTVDGGRRGIDESEAVEFGHGLEEVYGRRDIVEVVGEGDLGRLPNRFVRLK